LRNRIEEFVHSRGKRHLISIKADPNSNYNTYFQIQNEIVAAYNVIRNQCAIQKYGRRYDLCSQDEKEIIKDLCPQRIAEDYNTGEEGGTK
jgi:hypothetical protein